MIHTTHGAMTASDLADQAREAYGAWLDTLTPTQHDNLEWYGDPCGDINGIDGPAVPCTCRN
ncbi:hypothetical protein ACQP10_38330 (plasmid) [Streptosporangium sandarakinum]|uniref:hypothetical protein n=1 Tax=Streptosporangium sandarakinum TaxID=1260955 RepID=UPI003D8BB0B6